MTQKLKKMKLWALAGTLLVGLSLAGAQADVIDQTNGPGSTPHGITSSFWHGQTFTPTFDFLTAVEIWGNGADHGWSGGITPGTEMTATIYEANGFSGINLVLGAQLGSDTRTMPMAPPGDGQQWNGRFEFGFIDVSSRVGASLDNGLVVLFNAEPGFTGEETVWLTEFNAYTGGTGVQSNNGGSTWTWDHLGPTRDMSFRTYGDVVPEPGVLALLVCGALLLKVRRSRIS
jgi:hypothetical protein